MLLFFLHAVLGAHHVLNWTVQWSVLDPDGFPRPVITVQNMSSSEIPLFDNILIFPNKLGGPTVHVRQGDSVDISVTNHLLDSVISIHWHGLHMLHQADMDGVVGITQAGILPKHTFVYRFNITQPPGMYFYHSHSGLQSSDGFQGMFVIEDVHGIDLARDYVVPIQDWSHELYTTLYVKYTSRNGAYNSFQADYPYPATSILISGKGQFDCLKQIVSQDDCEIVRKHGWQYLLQDKNESFALLPPNDTFGTNGQCNPSRPPYMGPCSKAEKTHTVFECVPGTVTRLRLVGAGFSLGLRVWVDQHNLTIVAKDGYDIQPMLREAVFLHAGERLDVLVNCVSENDDDERLEYMVFAAIAYEYYGKRAHLKSPNVSSFAILRYVGATNNATVQCPPESWPQSSIKPDYFYTSNFFSLPASQRFVVWSNSKGHWWNYERDVDGKRLEWWELNNHTQFIAPHNTYLMEACSKDASLSNIFSPVVPLVFRLVFEPDNPRVYEFVIVNNESQPHPWHVHGHTVDVIHIGPLCDVVNDDLFPTNESSSMVMRADTFVIPSKSYAQFRLVANNPGPWLVHCHMPYHSEVGMAFLLSVEYDGKECAYKPISESTIWQDVTTVQIIVIVLILLVFCPICVSLVVCVLGRGVKWHMRRTHRRQVGMLNDQYVQDVSLSSNFKANETASA